MCPPLPPHGSNCKRRRSTKMRCAGQLPMSEKPNKRCADSVMSCNEWKHKFVVLMAPSNELPGPEHRP